MKWKRKILSDIGGKNMLKVLIGESSKGYKRKKQETEESKSCINMP